jgi:hypothetical protein
MCAFRPNCRIAALAVVSTISLKGLLIRMSRIGSAVFLAVFLVACRSPVPMLAGAEGTSSLQQSLPFEGASFDILADDVDGDARPDIILVSHGGNYAQVFLQKGPRAFTPSSRVPEVGFHPGAIIRLPSDRHLYLAAGEGSNQLILFQSGPSGKFEVVGRLAETAPRYATTFRWPGWGMSLAVSPFQKDFLVLLKDMDVSQGQVAARLTVPLSERGASLHRPGRVVSADIDGDGVDELLFMTERTNSLWMIRRPEKADETVTPVLIRDFQRGTPSQVVAIDVNGDKALDLVVPNQTEPFQIHILLNDGHGTFKDASPLSFPTTMGIRQVAAGTDKDGVNYLMAVGYGTVAIYRFPHGWGGRAAVPMRSVPMAQKEASQDLVLKDLDGDGWLDAIVGRSHREIGAWILYGPLWEHFELLAARQFLLN